MLTKAPIEDRKKCRDNLYLRHRVLIKRRSEYKRNKPKGTTLKAKFARETNIRT